MRSGCSWDGSDTEEEHNKERGEKLKGLTFWANFILCVGRSKCEGVGRGCEEGKEGARIGECERNHYKSLGKLINNIKCI